VKKIRLFIATAVFALLLSAGAICSFLTKAVETGSRAGAGAASFEKLHYVLSNEGEEAPSVSVSTFEELQTALSNNAKNVVVASSMAFLSTIEVNSDVVISSSGDYTFERAAGFKASFFRVKASAALLLSTKNGTSMTFEGNQVVGGAPVFYNEGALDLGENVTIQNFKLEVGDGVAVYNAGTFVLSGANIIDNVFCGEDGDIYDPITGQPVIDEETGNIKNGRPGAGIIYCDKDSVLNILGGKISNNESIQSGTVYIHDGVIVKMSGGEISNNRIWGGLGNKNVVGGAMYIKAANVTLSGGKIVGNEAIDGGGVQCTDTAVVLFDGVEISNNISTGEKPKKSGGGGVSVKKNAVATFRLGKISGNTAYNGGGIMCDDHATIIIEGMDISGNAATNQGAGICFWSDSTLTMKSGNISANKAATGAKELKGAGVYLQSSAKFVMQGGEIFSNSGAKFGGAVALYGSSSMLMTDGIISENRATSNGGALLVNAETCSLTIQGGRIVKNSASNGGAITTKGELKISGGTITENTARNNGGGIYLYSSGRVSVTGGDFANTAANGNDIFVKDGQTVSLLGGTFTHVKNGGGVIELGNSVQITGVVEMAEGVSDVSVRLVEELAYVVNIKMSSATPVNFIKFGRKEPYYNVYRFIKNVKLTDNTKTLEVSGSEIRVAIALSEIQVIAEELYIEIQKTAAAGQTVQFKPIAEFSISDVTILSSDGSIISYTQDGDVFSFVMPAEGTVQIDYNYAKKTLPIFIDQEIAEFLQMPTQGEFLDIIRITLREIVGKKLENLYVGNGTWQQKLDLYNPEFKMFAGATITGTFIDYADALETLPGTVVLVTNEEELLGAFETNGAIIAIMEDITLTRTLMIPEGTYSIVSVNGSVLLRGSNLKGNMIHIGWRTTLNFGYEGVRNIIYVDGRNLEGTVGSLIFVEDGGVVNMYDGTTLRNNRLLCSNTNFEDFGKGAKNAGGAAVYNYNGIFNMYGGVIADNYSTSYGAGVYNAGRFNLYGGVIRDNHSTVYGGGVYNLRVFNQEGGDILNNIAGSDGAGLYNAKTLYSYYYLISGRVSGNECSRNGAGVFVSAAGVTWIKGGEISQNTANANGGAIATKGNLFVIGGSMAGNTAAKSGGGIYTYCDGGDDNFTNILGGEILSNGAELGGAIAIKGGVVATISGTVIKENLASVMGGGIYSYVEGYLVAPKITLKNLHISQNVSPDDSQVCISDGVLMIGEGAEIIGKIVTVKDATEDSAYIKFINNLDFELEFNPHKYADYENEQHNVFVVQNGLDLAALLEKIKLTNTQYSVKESDGNLFIYAVN